MLAGYPEGLLKSGPWAACRPYRVACFVFSGGPPPGAVLAVAEAALPLRDVALSRWRAWARHTSGWVRNTLGGGLAK